MSFVEKLALVKRLHAFIDRKGTGNHEALAGRLGISVSALYRHLDILKSLGADIAYCHHRQTFYYQEDFDF